MTQRNHHQGFDDPRRPRWLWRGFLAVLALAVAAEFVVHMHPRFGIESVFGFAAWFGFGACAAMVAVAKALALWLQRPDTYYGQRDE